MTKRWAVAAIGATLLIGVVIAPAGAADGDLDPTFGGDGRVVNDFGFDDRAEGVAIDAAGRIVIAGTSCNGDILVARYLSNGDLDMSFSGDGWLCADVGGGTADQGADVIVLADGRILVGGTSAGDFVLLRFDGSGNPDATFGTGGRATYDLGGTEVLHDIALAPDGDIVLVGETTGAGCAGVPGPTPGQTSGVAVARTDAQGTPDAGFGVGGEVVLLDDISVRRGFAGAVQPDGAVIVVGRASSCSRVSVDTLVLRLTATGAPDPSFTAAHPLSEAGPDSAVDVLLEPTGSILVLIDTFVGIATVPARDDAFYVARYTSTGAAAGLGTSLFGAERVATPRALARQGDKIVAGGWVDGNFALARFNADLTPDLTFDGDERVETDFGGDDAIAALAVQADGKIVAAGRTNTDVALARYGTSAPPTTSSTTTSSSTTSSTTTTSTSSTTTTTIRSPLSTVCATLRGLRDRFSADPRLPRVVTALDAQIGRRCRA